MKGIHVLGPNAGEIIQGLAVAIRCGVTKEHFDDCAGMPGGWGLRGWGVGFSRVVVGAGVGFEGGGVALGGGWGLGFGFGV